MRRFSDPTIDESREALIERRRAEEVAGDLGNMLSGRGWNDHAKAWIDAYIERAHLTLETPIEREKALQLGGGCKALREFVTFLTTSLEEARETLRPDAEEDFDGP